MRPIDISRALAIQGWMRESELRWLAEMASHARKILEIGSWKGRSTRALADNTTGNVFVIDAWKDPEEDADQTNPELVARGAAAIKQDWRANLADHLETGRIVLFAGRSPAAVKRAAKRGPFDLIFIDGDHSYQGCLADIKACRPLVKPGGILAGHDYGEKNHPGVKPCVDEIFGLSVHVEDKTIWWVQL